MKIELTKDDGSIIDVTELVATTYDLVTQSMDWGSGFLVNEDVIAIKTLARHAGYESATYEHEVCECGHNAERHWRGRCRWGDPGYAWRGLIEKPECHCIEYRWNGEIRAVYGERPPLPPPPPVIVARPMPPVILEKPYFAECSTCSVSLGRYDTPEEAKEACNSHRTEVHGGTE